MAGELNDAGARAAAVMYTAWAGDNHVTGSDAYKCIVTIHIVFLFR